MKIYSSGLFIADFAAMSHSCAVWPAYWSVGDQWPSSGEIDVIEGVNLNTTFVFGSWPFCCGSNLSTGINTLCTLAQMRTGFLCRIHLRHLAVCPTPAMCSAWNAIARTVMMSAVHS